MPSKTDRTAVRACPGRLARAPLLHAQASHRLHSPAFGLALVPGLASSAALHLPSPYSDSTYDYAAGVADNGAVIGNEQDFRGSVPVVWSKGANTCAPAVLPAFPVGAEGGELRWISPTHRFSPAMPRFP